MIRQRLKHFVPKYKLMEVYQSIRRIMTTNRRLAVLRLAHQIYEPDKISTNKIPLLIIHGLFGSSKNWQSLSNALSRKGRKVIAVDARNHGDSPHDPDMNYNVMSEDLAYLIQDLDLENIVLLGHSMGGKVAMTLALKKPELIDKLIIEDVSPSLTKTSSVTFPSYIDAMKNATFDNSLNISQLRQHIGQQLKPIIKDKTTRNFILTNVIHKQRGYEWRVNLDSIENCLPDIMEFPNFDTTYDGETLFIAGEKSQHICPEHEPEIKRLFPKAQIVRIPNSGHWVHYDTPMEFIRTVLNFIDNDS